MSAKHQAALLTQQGGPFVLSERPTPSPGPNEVLVSIQALAVCPMDQYQRDLGILVPAYPTVIGCDAAGVVTKLGSNVPSSSALSVGTRVLGAISGFHHNWSPDHCAFQQFALTNWQSLTPIPDHLSFTEAAMLPLAVLTAMIGFSLIGVPAGTSLSSSEKQAVLIWGGSSSVGSVAVQIARNMGFVVYATAGAANAAYVRRLGAHAVFDYKSPDVVARIVRQAREDGVSLRHAQAVVDGSLQPILDVLRETKGEAQAQVAHAPWLPDDHPKLENTLVHWVVAPQDAKERDQLRGNICNEWLRDALKKGEIVPSPKMELVEGGLGGLNRALDRLREGVSATKLVLEV